MRHNVQTIFLLALLSVVAVPALIFGAPPGTPYDFGETLTPSCEPGSTNCTVKLPAARGANSDITSLAGLTTPLSISQGGTGLSTLVPGSLLYAVDDHTISSISPGEDGQVLTLTDGALEWAGLPAGTVYSAGTGLTLTNNQFELDLSDFSLADFSGTLPLSQGGTGVTNLSDLKNLFTFAEKGNNSDITSLTGLTTPLSVIQGGTGATSLSGLLDAIGGVGAGANSSITSLTGLTTPLSVTQGGTGQTSLSGLRTAISAAVSGANSDITSLASLSTPLTVAQGGTGAATLSGIVKGNGTGALTAVTAPSGNLVGTSDSQTLTNKTIDKASNTIIGLASSGANTDITSLASLSTPLSVTQGGTGVNTLTGIVKGTGTSALTAVTAPSGALVGTTDSQTITNKTIDKSLNTLTGVAASGANTDITSLGSLTSLAVNGTATILHLKSSGGTPSISAGGGAGAAASVSVSGTDMAGEITVTTGALPSISSTIFTLTFANAYSTTPRVIFVPSNAVTALLSGLTQVFVTPLTSNFRFTSGATGLTTLTTYKWQYLVIE